MGIVDRAQGVMSREDLVNFIEQFSNTVREEPVSWENDSLEGFLKAWSAWLRDMDGYFINRGEGVPAEPSWQLIAQMLLAARTYE